MINRRLGLLFLFLLIILAGVLNFMPRVNYDYPIHVDEYVHYQYSNALSEAPQYFGGDRVSLEKGFHILLAVINSFGVDYLDIFKLFPIIFTALVCLSVFITTRRIFNFESGLFAVLFLVLLRSTAAILGPMFAVPLVIGMILIPIGIFLLEIKSNLFFLPLPVLLIIHPPSALAYFIIINLYFVGDRKNIMSKIGLEILAFLIALPLYIPTFMEKGAGAVNNLSFSMIIAPLFIPRFLGYFVIFLIAIGIYCTSLKKRYDLISYVFAFLVLILLFYKFDFEFFVPYARTLMYLFIIFSMLFGYGCYNILKIPQSKRGKVIISIILIILIIITTIPFKLESTREVYHIMDRSDFNAFNYIKENTARDAVVLADPWKANAITPIGERVVYSRIMQGPNSFYEERNREIEKFFEDECENLEFLEINNISIVYGECANPELEEIYENVHLLSR